MTRLHQFLILMSAVLMFSGCAYRYYLGMHGPSVHSHPEIHAGVTEDSECLACHDPEKNAPAPATSHPDFTGCLKCHSD